MTTGKGKQTCLHPQAFDNLLQASTTQRRIILLVRPPRPLEYRMYPSRQSDCLQNSVFCNVDVRKGGFNFSKCSECEHYKDLIDMSIKSSEERENLKRELKKHNHQGSCRNLYHAWRHESKINPREVLAIIHDGMDTNKTAIPRLRVITKATAWLFQLPVSLTGMVTHGHGDSTYAQYATDLWPKDSNFTISSLVRCLRALETPPIRNSKKFFEDPPLNDYFDKLL